MPGFLISNLKEKEEINNINETQKEKLFCDSFNIYRSTIKKFNNDKVFYNGDNVIVILEGVILNKKELFIKYSVDNTTDLILNLYKEIGEDFFSKFRGSFSGAYYIKEEKKWIVYTNHYGDNTVYYYFDGMSLLIGSQVDYILEDLKENDIGITINEEAILSMLTYGYRMD